MTELDTPGMSAENVVDSSAETSNHEQAPTGIEDQQAESIKQGGDSNQKHSPAGHIPGEGRARAAIAKRDSVMQLLGAVAVLGVTLGILVRLWSSRRG